MLFIFSSSGGVDADGNDWMENHDDCCPAGFTCEYDSQYYSQCKESTSTKKTITKKRTFNFLKAKAKQAFKGTKGRIHAKDETCKTDSDWLWHAGQTIFSPSRLWRMMLQLFWMTVSSTSEQNGI